MFPKKRVLIRSFAVFVAFFAVGHIVLADEMGNLKAVPDHSKPDFADSEPCKMPFPYGYVDSSASVGVKFDVDNQNKLSGSKLFFSSGNKYVDQKVLAYIKKCNFQSALKDGVPVAGSFIKEFHFSIPGRMTPFSEASESSIGSYSYFEILNTLCPGRDEARERALAKAKQHLFDSKRKMFEGFPSSPLIVAIRKNYDELEKNGPSEWQMENFSAYLSLRSPSEMQRLCDTATAKIIERDK